LYYMLCGLVFIYKYFIKLIENMTIEKTELDKILKQYGPTPFHFHPRYSHDSKNLYESLRIVGEPLGNLGTVEYLIAKKIAKKNGVDLGYYDFDWKEDEPSQESLVFDTTIESIEQFDNAMKGLENSKDQLQERISKIADYLLEL